MTRYILHKLWPLALLAALVLTACGGSSSQPAGSQTSSGSTQKATATVSVQFPQPELAKALIDDRTSRIQLQWYSIQGYYYNWLGSTDLTPANPTATVEVPIGPVAFDAVAFRTDPTSGFEIEMARASTAGQIAGGNTNITLRFLLGDWQFVDADGSTPLPLVLNSSTGPITMQGFSLNGFQQYSPPQGMASKSAIDYTKPVGWADYSMRWYRDDGAGNPVPFGNPDWAGHDSQFVSDGTTTVTASAVESDGVILDTPITTGEPIGKRIAFIVGGTPSSDETLTGSTGQDLIPTIAPIADSRDLDGTHMAGHLLELTFDSRTDVVTQSNVDCTLYWNQMGSAATPAAARARAVSQIVAASTGAKKAAPGAVTTIDSSATLNYTDCLSGIQDGDGDGDYFSDFLSVDVNGNGVYEPQLGDQYIDYNNDGNYDWLIYPAQVDGGGVGTATSPEPDYLNEYLSYDANYNGRLDPGDTFVDSDNDGAFDFTYYAGELVNVTETFSNILAREFRAKASYTGTLFQPVAASNSFIQYRTYETSASNRFQGWIEYKSGDLSVQPADIAKVQLFDPSGTELLAFNGAPVFRATKFQTATWDGSQFGAATSTGYAGYSFDLSGYTSLPSGNYTFETTLRNGRTFNTVVNFPGQVALPVVSSTAMNYTWNGDGSLTLNWNQPTGTFDTYRIVLANPSNGLEVFYGSASPGTTSVTLSAAMLQGVLTYGGLPPTASLNWTMQTRNYAGTVNTARGISNPVTILPPGGGSAVGAWIKFDAVSNNVSIVGLLDASNYLEGEDGIPDLTGGPGMERGTYVANATTGDTTFTVQYETNGDWGPATAGTPNTVNVSVSGNILSVFVPATLESFSFDRVVPDPMNPVVGAWYFNNAGFESLLVLLGNGQYFVAEGSPTDLAGSHFEHGTYSWNSSTGALSATGVFNSSATAVAIAAPGVTNNNISVSVSSTSMTWTDPSGTYTATRL